MSKKINIAKKVWATKLPENAASPADYFLWREVDGSDMIAGHFYYYEAKNRWQLDAGGSTYEGVSLGEVAQQYLEKLGK